MCDCSPLYLHCLATTSALSFCQCSVPLCFRGSFVTQGLLHDLCLKLCLIKRLHNVPAHQPTMEPTTYKLKCAMATDLGYSAVTNSKQRELPWYGLWNIILTEHFPVASPFLVSPQYPVWHLDDVDGEMETGDISLTLKPGDLIPGGIVPANQSSADQSF